MRGCDQRGQSLVEVALVMPVFAFVVWTLAQLAFFCMNLVEHQRMAQVAAENLTIDSFMSRRPYHWFYRNRGTTIPALVKTRVMAIPEQKDPHAFAVIKTGGRLFHVQVTSQLLPGAFMGRFLKWANQTAAAEAWMEPDAPEGD